MARILVADDEQDLRDALRRVCERDGHEVALASNGAEAVELVRTFHPDLAVLDNRMPVESGLDALARIRRFDPSLTVVLFTAYDDAADVRRAVLDLGAYSYLTKDSGVENIRATIQQALRSRGILPATPPAPALVPAPLQALDFGGLVGRSPAMLELYSLVRRISHSDVTVLVHGESGTGKELIARAIHDNSRRARHAYVTVDCGTLPETLTESEIFGYEPGAFTDARKAKPGKIELADGGTLFLDEIGNMALSAQAKLLRVLEDRRVTRLGSSHVKEVDVRIIAATNVELAGAVRERSFREDLYYRLNVFLIVLPPLRERTEDIPLLVSHFVRRFSAEQDRALPGGISREAMQALLAHRWPGNVRELRNVLERAFLLADQEILPRHLPGLGEGPEITPLASPRGAAPASAEVSAPGAPSGRLAPAAPAMGGFPFQVGVVDLERVPFKEAKRLASEAVERAYLEAALRRARWNKSQAARLLGLNYKTFREKVHALDLERLQWDDRSE